MKTTQHVDIRCYSDDFEFAQAKKYVKIKAPLEMKIVHDHMYPLLKFDEIIEISYPKSKLSKGQLICYWHENIIHPCILKKVYNDKSFEVEFLNKKAIARVYKDNFFLGTITSPQLSIIWRLKLFLRCL